ncbi:hypothetical protein BpHYR1_010293 [Brachionus plicatilis]|uniref:Transmembrane protein n=1 Tax=Brachionus plicatilis TaxID=10195 RepID=A0A3M7S2Y0_BRAPC|nr:hypothetical protein BpHYR1_010293 [Brachionus plicatilis]
MIQIVFRIKRREIYLQNVRAGQNQGQSLLFKILESNYQKIAQNSSSSFSKTSLLIVAIIFLGLLSDIRATSLIFRFYSLFDEYNIRRSDNTSICFTSRTTTWKGVLTIKN